MGGSEGASGFEAQEGERRRAKIMARPLAVVAPAL